MKKFKYRLERVLQYRTVIKNEKQRDLLARRYQLTQAQERLQELEAAMLLNRIEDNAILEATELFMRGAYAERLKSESEQQKLKIIEIEKQVEEANVIYQEAAKETRTLETLKEKKQQQYQELVAKEDEKVLDELSIQKGNGNKQEPSSPDEMLETETRER